MIKTRFDRSDKRFDDLTEKMRVTNQRLAGLEQEARQSRLATGEDVEPDTEPDTKTRKRTEGASAAVRVKNGDSSSARVDKCLTSLTSFGMIAESTASEKCIGDILVNKGAEALKPHLPPMEVRMLSFAAGGLLPTGTDSTAMKFICSRPLLSWSLGEEAKERTGRTNFNQLAPPSSRKAILLGCGSFVRGRKRKGVDSRPLLYYRVNDIQETPVETSQYISINHPVSQSYIYQTPSTK